MHFNWQIKNVDELQEIAKYIATCGKKKFGVYGNMGAGKTTLIKFICDALHVQDTVSSPTFTIINEYEANEKIYHLDLYRIKNTSELTEIGFEEYLETPYYIFIEWPEIAEDILNTFNFSKIKITPGENNERIINLEA